MSSHHQSDLQQQQRGGGRLTIDHLAASSGNNAAVSGGGGTASSPKKSLSGSFRHSPYACGNNNTNNNNNSGNLSPCGPQSPVLGATSSQPQLSAYHQANNNRCAGGGYGGASHHASDDESGMYGGGYYEETAPTSDPRFLGSPTHHHYGSQNSMSNGSFSRHPTATSGSARGGGSGGGMVRGGSGYSSHTASPPPAASPHQPTIGAVSHNNNNNSYLMGSASSYHNDHHHHHHHHNTNNNNMGGGGGSMSSSMYNSFDHHTASHHHHHHNHHGYHHHSNSQNGSFSGAPPPDAFYGSSSHHPYQQPHHHHHPPTTVLPPPPPTVPTTIRIGTSTTIQPLPPHLQPASPLQSASSPTDSQRGEVVVVRNKIMRGGMSAARGRGTTTTPSSPSPASEEHIATTATTTQDTVSNSTTATPAAATHTNHQQHQQHQHLPASVGGSSVPTQLHQPNPRELSQSGAFGASLDAAQYSPHLEASGSNGDINQLPTFPETDRGVSQGRTPGGVRSSNSVDQDYYSENTSTTATGKSTGSKRRLRRGTRGGNVNNTSATDSAHLPVARSASLDEHPLDKATPGGQASSEKYLLSHSEDTATPSLSNVPTPNSAHYNNNNTSLPPSRQHLQQRPPIHIDPLVSPGMGGATPPSTLHHNNSSLSTQPAQYSGPVTPNTSPHPVSGSPSPQPNSAARNNHNHHLPHHHHSSQQLHAHSPKALCGVGLLPLERKTSFSFSGGGGVGSSSGGSSLRDGLPLCEQDDACPEINNPTHQQQFAHTCRLYPCYHGHIRRHAKLFRHVPGQVIKMPNSSFDDRSMSSAGSNIGGRSNNGGGGGSVCGSIQKSRASNKASRLALSSVAYSSISADSPNAYRITVKNGDTAYDIHGDWMNVKVHTFKRYLHQVFGVEAKYQTLALERWVHKSTSNLHKRAATPDGGDNTPTAGVTNSSDDDDDMSGSTTTSTSSSLSSSVDNKKVPSNITNINKPASDTTTSRQNTTELDAGDNTPAQPQQLHRKLVKMEDDLGKVGGYGVVEGSVVVLLLDRGHQANNIAASSHHITRSEEDPALKAAQRDERKRAVMGDL